MAWLQSHSLWVQEFAEGLAVLQFDPPGKYVRLTMDVLAELDAALTAIEKEPRFRALVVRSLKEGRFAQGPDVPGWKALSGEIDAWASRGQAVWNRLYGLKIPTVAWVQGTCLGPGFELALACDRIVVVDHATTTLGFSELDLGLLPCWGGVLPFVKRVGVQNATPLVLAGRRLSAREAMTLGLGDRIVHADEPNFQDLLASTVKRDPNRWTRRTWRQRVFERFAAGRRLIYRGIERLQQRRLPDDLPAPRLALHALKTFVERGLAEGQAVAKAGLVELARSSAFANLVRLHELRETTAVPAKTNWREKTVGILGATPLGMRLVGEIVRRESSVVLRETDEGLLGFSIYALVQTLSRDVQAGKLSPKDSQRTLSRIKSTVTWKNFDEVDLVIDTRDRPAKLPQTAAEIDANVPGRVCVGVAALGGRIAEASSEHASRLAGINVLAPLAPVPVVELRRSATMEAGAFRSLRELFAWLGWPSFVVGDAPSLLLARLWAPAWNEMVTLIREGIGPEMIDSEMVRFGLGAAPLEQLDSLGLERARELTEAVRSEVEPRVAIDPFWSEVLDRKWRGRRAGKGFYRYGRGRHRENHLLVNWLVTEGPRFRAPPLPPKAERRAFVRDRIVLLMVNEAFRCLEEGRVATSDELDLAMMLTDWAPHRGGPIQFARETGLKNVVAKLRELAVLGERYEPCERLMKESEAG